jgi:hypothetical protein
MPHARYRLNCSVRRYAHFNASTRSDLYKRGKGGFDGSAFKSAIRIDPLSIALKHVPDLCRCDREIA